MPSIYGAYSKYTRLRIDYSITQDIANNKSTINMTLFAERTKASQQAYNPSYYSMTGKELTAFSYNWSSTSYELEIGSSTIVVQHNEDGSAEKTLEGYWDTKRTGSSYIPEELTVSGKITLPTIARKSQVTLSKNSINLGDTITLYSNRTSTNFKHSFYYQVGSENWKVIASKISDANYSWNTNNVISDIADNFPNSKTGSLTIFCETFSGNTYIGASSATLSFNINSLPTVSNITVTGGINSVYIEDVSSITTNITASGIYGSTIKSYRIELYKGSTKIKENYSSSTSATFPLTGLNLSADTTITLKATVIDTRGNTGTKSTPITVKDYSAPTITSRSAYRCNSDGTANSSGTYLRIYWAYSTTSIAGVTTDTATVKYRQKGATAWTTATIANGGTVIVGSGKISTDYQYEVQYSITDGIAAAPTVATDTIPTGYTTVDYRAGGKGIAFGKVSEKDEFECNMPADFKKTISWESVGYTNTDYNTMKKSGIYYMSTGCSNSPEGQSYLRLLVMGASYSGDITQIATNVVTGNTWIRTCLNDTWHDWAKVGTAVKKATQTSTAGWYRVAILRGAGHNPNNVVILNVATNYNYNAPCSVMLAIITSWKNAKITQLTAVDTSNNPTITQARVQYDETNANFYIDVYYNKSSLNAILVRNENILDKQTEIYAPYHIASSSLTDIDNLEIDYSGINLRPRPILTAKPSANLTITGTAWTDMLITLNAVHGYNNSINRLTLSNGGIKIGAGIKKVKVSASIGYHTYATTGETDLRILKYAAATGTNEVIGEADGVNPIANQMNGITSNSFVVEVKEGDIIKLAILKSSANAMTITTTHNSTSLTVEVVG